MTRRQVLYAAGAAGLGTAGFPMPVAAAASRSSSDPVSMAMHIHGSFSEGTASMDTHLDQASQLGVDVIWWTDHDFRRSAFGYRTAIGFDGPSEPDGPWNLTWEPSTSGNPSAAWHDFVDSPTSPDETGNAMRIHAIGDDSQTWSTYMLAAECDNFTYSTSYSDTTLVLDVLPQSVGDDAALVITIVSSYRPATRGRPAGQYSLQYRVGSGGARYTTDLGLTGVVPIAATSTENFQRLTMDLRGDHASFWPDTVADDASLWKLLIGVQARNGATAQGVVDRLRFQRTRQTPDDGLQLLLAAMEPYHQRYPTVRQYASSEISLVLHLNAFGGTRATPAYTGQYAVKSSDFDDELAMVEWLHGENAVVSINHPLQGVSGPKELASRLVDTNGMHADVIEIGTTSKANTLAKVFDIAARNAVFLTANGTTDDHAGADWLGANRRWLTSVWAPSVAREDLCSALKAGRAWFFDPLYWRGTIDLETDAGPMGSVSFSRGAKADVSVNATDLPSGGSLEFVRGVCDRAGSQYLHTIDKNTTIAASKVPTQGWSTTVEVEKGCYVRAVVRSAEGDIVGFSNPLWVLPDSARGEVDVPRSRKTAA